MNSETLSATNETFSCVFRDIKYSDCSVTEEYQCDNSKCISLQLLCDDSDDCGDSSDERNCCKSAFIFIILCMNDRFLSSPRLK